jgi:hypothetical protein
MVRRSWSTLLGLALGALSVPSAAAGPSDAEAQALEKKIIGVLNGKGPQMDQCVERYLEEYPAADGGVQLKMEIGKGGVVVEATADTTLEGARNLRPCIAKVAKGYVFPEPARAEKVTLTINLVVKKGAKFKLYGPGESPPKPEAREGEPIFHFMPTGWTATPE